MALSFAAAGLFQGLGGGLADTALPATGGRGHFVTGLSKFKVCRDKTRCATKSFKDGEVGERKNGGDK